MSHAEAPVAMKSSFYLSTNSEYYHSSIYEDRYFPINDWFSFQNGSYLSLFVVFMYW